MYVCICNGITDHQIRDAVADGATSMNDLQQNLGVASCCGRCSDCARGVHNQALDENRYSFELVLQVA